MRLVEERWRSLVVATMVAGIAARLIHITADAPRFWLDRSTGVYTDEGFFAHDAFLKATIGDWTWDEFVPMAVSPLYSIVVFATWKTFGVSLAALRILPIVAGLGASALIAIAAWLKLGRRVGLIALGLLLLMPGWIAFNRLGLLETFVVAAMSGVLLLLCGDEVPPWRAFVAGLVAFLGFLFKPSALVVVAMVVAAELLEMLLRRWERATVRAAIARCAAFGAGLAVGAAAWVVGWYEPHREIVGKMTVFFARSSPKFASTVRGIATDAFAHVAHEAFVTCFPFLSFAALFAFATLSLDDLRAHRLLRIAVAWTFVSWLYLAALAYDPVRYHLVALPGLVIVAAWFLSVVASEPERLLQPRVLSWCAFPFAWRLLCHLAQPGKVGTLGGDRRTLLFTAIPLVVGVLLLLARTGRISRPIAFIAPLAFFAALLAFEGRRLFTLVANPQYDLAHAAQIIANERVHGRGAGPWALAIEPRTGIPAARDVVDWINLPETWPKLGIGWYLGNAVEIDELKQRYGAFAGWRHQQDIKVAGERLQLLTRPE